MKKYYKVVTEKLRSIYAGNNMCSMGFSVKYKIDEFVGRPTKCGPLAVFRTKRDAINFMFIRCQGWLFECAIEMSKEHEFYNRK